MAHLLHELERTHRKRGAETYSNVLDNTRELPGDWQIANPDLLIAEGSHITTVLVVDSRVADEQVIAQRCTTISGMNPDNFIVMVRDRDTLKTVESILRKRSIHASIRIIRRAKRNRSRRILFNPFSSDRKVDWILGGLFILVFIGSLILFAITVRRNLEIPEFYSPKDEERQDHILK